MGLWQHFSVCSTELQLPSHCEIELLNLVCHRAHSHRQAHGCGRCRTSLIQVSKHNLAFAGISRHMTVLLLFPLAALLLTSKRRSTVEPGTREDSLWPAMQHSCTACDSSRIAILVSKPRMFSGSNATSLLLQLCLLRERTGLWPRVTTTLLSGDRQAPSVDEGPFPVQNSGFFGRSRRGLKHVSRRGLKYVPTSDQGEDFYTQLTHAVFSNHPADNSDVWVPVTTKGVKTQVDFSPGGFSSSYMRGCLLSVKNKFSGSAN